MAAGCGSATAITAAPDASTHPNDAPEAGTAEASADVDVPTPDDAASDVVEAGLDCAAVLAKLRAEPPDGGTFCFFPVSNEVACCMMQTQPDCASYCAPACAMKGCAMGSDYASAYYTANPPDAGDGGNAVCPRLSNPQFYCAIAGRRPAGLRARPARLALEAVWSLGGGMFAPSASRDAVAGWLASNARLEAASVVAFERLAAELRDFGAPEALARRCEAAAMDEARHAAITSRLARARGAVVPVFHVEAPAPRPLVDLAIENVVEGCVRETYAAAMVLHMSQHARDRVLGEALASIAEDEAHHAELAAAIATWIDSALTEIERARVEAARRDAIAALAHELASAPPVELCAEAGVPDAARAQRLVGLLDRHVWRAAA